MAQSRLCWLIVTELGSQLSDRATNLAALRDRISGGLFLCKLGP